MCGRRLRGKKRRKRKDQEESRGPVEEPVSILDEEMEYEGTSFQSYEGLGTQTREPVSVVDEELEYEGISLQQEEKPRHRTFQGLFIEPPGNEAEMSVQPEQEEMECDEDLMCDEW